jgi:hypothetical protein
MQCGEPTPRFSFFVQCIKSDITDASELSEGQLACSTIYLHGLSKV